MAESEITKKVAPTGRALVELRGSGSISSRERPGKAKIALFGVQAVVDLAPLAVQVSEDAFDLGQIVGRLAPAQALVERVFNLEDVHDWTSDGIDMSSVRIDYLDEVGSETH